MNPDAKLLEYSMLDILRQKEKAMHDTKQIIFYFRISFYSFFSVSY